MPKDNYCRSEYDGNRCEDADGHEGPHSHWIEGYGDMTWTDEQAEAERRKVVDYWAERIMGAVAREGRESPTRSEMRVGIVALRLLLTKDVPALLDALSPESSHD